MATELAEERLGWVLGLSRKRGWQALLVYGNAWCSSYFRYISIFSILQGRAFALLTADGDMALFLEATCLEATELQNQIIADDEGDKDRVEPCLAERATAIAHADMGAASAVAIQEADANLVVTAAERKARRNGVEKALIAVAPDISNDPRLRRIEGGSFLGPEFALQVSVAYKGLWTRLGRILGRTASEPSGGRTAWFEEVLSDDRLAVQPGPAIDGALGRQPEVTREFWHIDRPSIYRSCRRAPVWRTALSASRFFTLAMRLRRPDGWWYSASPLPLRKRGEAMVPNSFIA